MITKATNNINKTFSIKYGYKPNQVEEKILEDDIFVDLYNFHRLFRVKDDEDRVVRQKERKFDHKKSKLRNPLDIGEKVLVIADCLKKIRSR